MKQAIIRGVPNHPLSLRKTRSAVVGSLAAINQHAEAINQLREVAMASTAQIDTVSAVLARGFWGRLRWLVLGR